MSARMFAAVVPPEAVLDDVAGFVESRRLADDRLRWTPPTAWHLTTAFMASVDERHLDRLVENLAEAAARTPAFDLQLRGGGAFPTVVETRVLWLGVRVGEEPLRRLAARSRTAAERAGVPVDGARFVGHLTLARARRPFNATRWLGILDSYPGTGWRVGELVLIESHLRDRSHRYETVARLPLGAHRGEMISPGG